MKMGVLGAAGRMGQSVCEAISKDNNLELVAAVDLGSNDALEVVEGIHLTSEIEDLITSGSQVVIDFTMAEASRENLPILAKAGLNVVVGTSGLNSDDLDEFKKVFLESSCLVVPNFAIGAVLMMHFAAIAAPWFNTAEIIEYHHDNKIDAPSGTAIATAEKIAAASNEWNGDPTTEENLLNSRGAHGEAGVKVHAVRMEGMVAHQDVILGTTGQTLTIRHDAIDRESFMPGVLLAAKGIEDLPNGLIVGLDAILGI